LNSSNIQNWWFRTTQRL